MAPVNLLVLYTVCVQIEDLPNYYCNLQIGTVSSGFGNSYASTFMIKLHRSLSNVTFFFLANNQKNP